MARALAVLAVVLASGCKTVPFASRVLDVESDTIELEGHAKSIGADRRAVFVTVDDELKLEMSMLSNVAQEQLQLSQREDKRVKVEAPRRAIESLSKNPLKIRPDCNELPTSYDELVAIARNATSLQQFLDKIPKGTMQTFTFVHTSNSPIKGEITPSNPRVIRASVDTKLIMAYTCRANSPHANRLEVIRFDDKDKRFKLSEFNFGATPDRRVFEDPDVCRSCHAPNPRDPDPRPNWQMYFTWDGVFGIHDDQLGGAPTEYTMGRIEPDFFLSRPRSPVTRTERPPGLTEEINWWRAFREQRASDPCYAALPWPQGEVPIDYANYPYSDQPKTPNYHMRPNLKLTETLSHLMGHRLARKLGERPQFQRLRYLVAMEGLACTMPDGVDELVSAVLPNFEVPEFTPPASTNPYQEYLKNFDPRLKQSGARLTYQIGRALNFSDADWTMTFNRPMEPVYNTGVSSDFYGSGGGPPIDVSIFQLTQAEVMNQLAAEYTEFKELYSTTRGESESFGPQFACLDDLGGKLYTNRRNEICELLKTKMKDNEAADLARAKEVYKPKTKAVKNKKSDLVRPIARDPKELDSGIVAVGQYIVDSACKRCHGETDGAMPERLMFMKDGAELAKRLQAPNGEGEELFRKIVSRIESQDRPMPPPGENDLADSEKDAIEAYLNYLLLGSPPI